MQSKFAQKKTKMCFSFWGTTSSPGPATGAPPRFPLGDFRPGGVVPLRHLRHVPPPPQTVLRLRLIVYRTELNHSVHNSERKNWENSPRDTVHSD